MKNIILLLFVFFSFTSYSQEAKSSFEGHKGDFYLYWGYNKSFHNPSDIHFEGEGYDFTLYDVYAKDAPEPYSNKAYFSPKNISIPQFNFRIAYFLTDKVSLSVGTDHMKYVMLNHQRVKITGYIDPELSEEYGGKYNDEYIDLDPEFMKYEHTNGFNFARFGLEYRSDLWHSKNGKHHAVIMPGVSIGATLPWTRYDFLGSFKSDLFHISGFGVSMTTAIRYEFKNTGFFQIQGQYGYTHMPRILLEDRSGKAHASQDIVFFERSFSIGAYIHSFNKHKVKKK